jgi:riboflavin kinase/FMN adenylyltransferase
MKVHRDLNHIPAFKNAVITIGSFDGVHLGHKRILRKITQLAADIGGESVAITFDPHPRLVVYPQANDLQLITTTEEKIRLMADTGIDHLVVVPFTIEFSQLNPDEYIEKFIVRHFKPAYIVIGYDHRFGSNRQGDINYLKWHGKASGYDVIEISRQEVDDIGISSTRIRLALAACDIPKANKLLGHHYSITGRVVPGDRIGNQLGFPTANLQLDSPHKLIPPDGIYACLVCHDHQHYRGMLYIGKRPSIRDGGNKVIEVNIFDFNQQIYGDLLRVELIEHLRKDMTFPSLEALKIQLNKDRETTREVFEYRSRQAEEVAVLPEKPFSASVVLLNFNGLKHLREFLPRVLETLPPEVPLVVADNGSTDKSVAFLQQHYPDIRLIELGHNYGFAKGYNLALHHLDDDCYVLLNSDIEPSENWLSPLLEAMQDNPRLAACQPKIKSLKNPALFEYAGAAGGWIDVLGYPFCRGRIFDHCEADEGQYEDTTEIFWASGAAMCVRGSLFQEVGGFDPDYFAHSEEIDLCWRLKRAGYRIEVVPNSVVYHLGGGTLNYQSPFKTYLNFRNSLYSLVKNEAFFRLIWILPLRLVLDGVAGLLFLSQGKWPHIKAIIDAHWTFFPRLPKLWQQRQVLRAKIRQIRQDEAPNLSTGRYSRSIVWDYYVRGRKQFSQLTTKKAQQTQAYEKA